MEKYFKKVLSVMLVCLMLFTSSINIFAAENYNLNQISNLLDSLGNTQEIQVSEYELLTNLVETNQITKEDLNKYMYELSSQSKEKLKKNGYDSHQVDAIKNYDGSLDALAYSTLSNATVTFRYGLAGTGTRKQVKIAYDIEWSSCPFFTFTDSFGIGWIAADRNSNELVTETLSAYGETWYYDFDDKNQGYRVIDMKKPANGVVTGNPIIGSAGGYYGKRMGGVIDVQTQSESYNMETIQIFIAYAHTTLSVNVTAGVTLSWKKVSGAISFTPTVKQTMMVEDSNKFFYNSQDVIIAR